MITKLTLHRTLEEMLHTNKKEKTIQGATKKKVKHTTN